MQALKSVSLEVAAGEVHAIIGENGAGKSTLMKVLSGAHSPNEGGSILFEGKHYSPASPAEGRNSGIAMIYQELNLAMHLTVEENIMLGMENSRLGFVQKSEEKIARAFELLGASDISPGMIVRELNIGKQQLVEIARALVSEARVVIMDEPTSSLSAADTKALFEVIRKLRDQGISVLYISHFLEEVKAVADRFTVLRDGETVASGDVADTSIDKMIEHMVGRSVDELYPAIEHEIGEPILEVKALKGAELPDNVNLVLRKGEILGIAGLVGAGRSETLRSIFGLHEVESGKVKLVGHQVLNASYFNPDKALKMKMDLLSEDRKEEGLAQNLSISSNTTLSALKQYARGGFLN